jgi:hypothetical protein
MDAKTILIVAGLVLALYLGGCFPDVNAQDTAPQPQTQMDPAECYAQVNAAVRDDWASMNKVQRFTVGMKAINLCENGGN